MQKPSINLKGSEKGKLNPVLRLVYLAVALIFLIGSIGLFAFSALIIPFFMGLAAVGMAIALIVCAIQGITINEYRARDKAKKMLKKEKHDTRAQEILTDMRQKQLK
jgi:predicted membrane protein